MNSYIDMDGVENVAVSLIRLSKHDFVTGGKILYRWFDKIPTQKELLNSKHKSLDRLEKIRHMYDAWNFVKKDPYSMFSDVGEKSVINSWTLATILDYHKDNYISGASILYKTKGKKEVYEVTNGTVKKKIKQASLADDFIKARDYVLSLPNHEELFKQWNDVAYKRMERNVKLLETPFVAITKDLSMKERQARKEKNVKRAKELFEAGISKKAIAKELGVQIQTINTYLRS